MNFLNKTTQYLGEGVGVFDKTEESEDFKKQEKYFNVTAEATDKLVKELTPESASGALHMLRDTLGKTSETKRAELFMGLGNDLQNAAPHSSVYAEALISLAESQKDIGEVHAEHDARLIENSVGPLKVFNENVLKEIQKLAKNYSAKRLEYDSAARANKKKSDGKTQAALDAKKRNYEEAKTAYLDKIATLPGSEAQQVGQIAEYCKSQAAFYKKISELYESSAQKLEKIKQNASTQSYSSGPSYGGGAPQGGYGNAPQGGYGNAPQGGYGGPPQGGYGGAPVSGGGPPPLPPAVRPSSLRQCRAIYDFNAEAGTELSFRRGDVITIRKQVNQDWIEGDLNGRVGLLPVNYVEMM